MLDHLMVRASPELLLPYVPRLIHDWQKTNPDSKWREVEGSMLFVDVSGFTRLSERLARQGRVGAEEITWVIGSTFGAILKVAHSYGGSLLKFGGDALLVFFEGDGHQIRAAAAAQKMMIEMRVVGSCTTSAGDIRLRMSVGAHSGRFLFFLVGRSHRELIVAGPAVSELVNIENAATAGQILVSPSLAGVLPRSHRGREIGPGLLLTGSVDAERVETDETVPDLDLTPFLPAALVQGITDGGLESDHRPVTVAFLRYTGLDQMLERSGTDSAARALDALVGNIQAAIDSRGVTFLASDVDADGGKIILTSGAPTATGNDEEMMLLALHEVVSAGCEFQVGAGVNRGHIFAGNVGPRERRTYTVMGDAVNLAARLMSRAATGQIITTAEVLAGSRTTFKTTRLEPFNVKGKRHPVDALLVGEPTGSRASTAVHGLPLVGRDSEFQVLNDSWEAARAGQGRLVEITAEPGMGKSRLLQQLLTDETEGRLLYTECRLYQATSPYFPFRTLMRQALEIEGLDESETVARLEEIVAGAAPHLGPWLSLIAVPLNLSIPESDEVAMLDDSVRRGRLQEAVWDLLSSVLDGPTKIVIEDAHWMDDGSSELLLKGAEILARRPWLTVVTRRSNQGGFVAPDDEAAVTVLVLEPLADEDAAALVNEATIDHPLMPQEVRALTERARGNPLFLFELLDALHRGEDVEGLPNSVEGLINARIDLLPGADRTLLRHLSVLGTGFYAQHIISVLPEVARQGHEPLVRRLADFVEVPRTGWIQFRQGLIRDAAYQGLPYRQRQKLHARVADSIRRDAGENPEEEAALLSIHYFHAGSWKDAWIYSRVAGDRARAVYANLEAASFYERALAAGRRLGDELPGLVELWESLAGVREQAGLFEASFEALREATRMATNPVDSARLHLERARARLRVGRYAMALRETSLGLRFIEKEQTREAKVQRAYLLSMRAHARLQQGHAREALSLAKRAVTEGEAVGEKDAVARSYTVMDNAYELLGSPELAVHEPKALEIYQETGDLLGVAVVANNLGVKAQAEGRWLEAMDRYSRAMDAYNRVGNESQAALVGANLGETLISLRRFAEAEEVLSEARRVLRAHDLVPYAIFAESQLARLAMQEGRPADAVVALKGLMHEAIEVGFAELVLDTAINLASAQTASGAPEVALQVIEEATAYAGDEAAPFEVSLRRVRAEALSMLDRVDEAAGEVDVALDAAREQGLTYEEANLLMIRSRLPGDGSTRDVEEADRLLQSLGLVTDSAPT